MDHIHLQHTLPQVFAARDTVISQVWHQDIVFDKGKRYLIEASSGTGKSSLCSYIYGYRRDYQGIISFDGRNIRSFSVGEWTDVRKHSLSILFQELRIFPELTALENVLLKNRLTNHKKKKRNSRPFRSNRHSRQNRRKSRQAFLRAAATRRFYPQPLPAVRLYLPGRTHQPPGQRQQCHNEPVAHGRGGQAGSRHYCHIHREAPGARIR